jgi:hypothetical protein
MDPATQICLLRVLETRRFTRVGANREEKADVRIVAATNSDLLDLVERRLFREDLFYRLNVLTIAIPLASLLFTEASLPICLRRRSRPLSSQQRQSSKSRRPGAELVSWHDNRSTGSVRRHVRVTGHMRLTTSRTNRKERIMRSMMGWAAIGVSTIGVMGIAGCAGSPVPNAKVASSEAAIRAAQETGSANVPQAALHLKLAEEQLASAKALIRDNENKRAEYVLMRTQADAELAIALSHVAVSNVQAGTAVDEARAVRSGTPTP